jgi:hypothetical protein
MGAWHGGGPGAAIHVVILGIGFAMSCGGMASAADQGEDASRSASPTVAQTPVAPVTGPAQPGTAPGAVNPTANEEFIEHALERTLVLQGAALVPFGQFEVQPEVDYALQNSNSLQTVTLSGVPTVVQSLRRDTVQPSLTARAGLPFETQIEVFVPYVYDREEVVPLATNTQASRQSSGIGDVSVALSKQLLHEYGAIPNLVATLRYKSKTGTISFSPTFSSLNVGTGTGFESAQGQLIATKRLDPLVFFGNATYIHNFSTTSSGLKIDPGDATDIKIGTILAVSPDAALTGDFELSYFSATRINGIKAAGSDQVIGFLDFGGSVVLSRSTVVNLTAGVGVTQASPSFRFAISFPIRF